ncbi:acyl-CoA/acyl-ACP dehydrogenase [Altererythrobacter arenosus]|uniref:Acyl-CoA/acyl-ACP dehydrogenase n=1 Tax=Altererythrobacter arenosus TaxID=3032592 RepID=A0ABY8FWS9_9SPHN|nr:acyl-CoA dehydrogenase family protein [Altererythrobacter sp. CAU 1644]WFL77691.1 acyl-CoA/acyl-ACP dehydrogenase [Altererythrobacter sp. CAU 1644]
MNFDLSEEQELFRSTVERFAAPIDVEARRKLRGADGGYPRERWRELAELGLIALAAREENGGLGGSPVDLALVAEAIGRANAPDPWLENGVLPALLLEAGKAEAPLAGVLGGEKIVAFAWAERGQRYNLAAHKTTVGKGSTRTLSGEKTFVLGSAIADAFLITAEREGETGIFLVSADRAGLDLRHYQLADGSLAGELRLNQVKVDDGDELALDASDLARIVADCRLYAAAELAGLGQKLLDDTLAYVKEREQFGVPIGSFQALQHRLVDCYARIEQSRSMLYRAALADRSDLAQWQRSAAGAKAFISENVDHVAREAVQMHGGMGITDELAIGHAMKRVLVLSRLFGDVDTNLAEYELAA